MIKHTALRGHTTSGLRKMLFAIKSDENNNTILSKIAISIINLVDVIIICLESAFSSLALYWATYFDMAGGNPPADSI